MERSYIRWRPHSAASSRASSSRIAAVSRCSHWPVGSGVAASALNSRDSSRVDHHSAARLEHRLERHGTSTGVPMRRDPGVRCHHHRSKGVHVQRYLVRLDPLRLRPCLGPVGLVVERVGDGRGVARILLANIAIQARMSARHQPHTALLGRRQLLVGCSDLLGGRSRYRRRIYRY